MISSVYNGYMIMKQLLLREIVVGFFVLNLITIFNKHNHLDYMHSRFQ